MDTLHAIMISPVVNNLVMTLLLSVVCKGYAPRHATLAYGISVKAGQHSRSFNT